MEPLDRHSPSSDRYLPPRLDLRAQTCTLTLHRSHFNLKALTAKPAASLHVLPGILYYQPRAINNRKDYHCRIEVAQG